MQSERGPAQKGMTVPAALTLTTSALSVGCSIMFLFFTYASKRWVEKIDDIEPRVTRLETQTADRWEEVRNRLDRIEKLLER